MNNLDATVPLGNPKAEHCRWCNAHKGNFVGYLLCPNCDVVHAIVR